MVRLDEDGSFRLPETGQWWVYPQRESVVILPRTPNLRKLYVEPTTVCNMACRICVHRIWDEAEAPMHWQLFGSLMDQAEGLPDLEQVLFTGVGEPLSHPDILDMVLAAKTRGLSVSLTTNGSLLTRPLASELIKVGLNRLSVSLDGADTEAYADIRRADFETVLGNLRVLQERKKSVGTTLPELEIEFVLLKRNAGQLPAMALLASRLGARRVLVSHVLAYTEEMYEEILYGYEPVAGLSTRGWPVPTGAWLLWGSFDLPSWHWSAERRCPFVDDRSAVIGWDGTVAPCLALLHNYRYHTIDGALKEVNRYSLGDIRKASLADIWSSEDYCRFRYEVANFRFPSCPDCHLRESCDLRQRNQGCWGWNPSCADCLYAQNIVRCPGAGR